MTPRLRIPEDSYQYRSVSNTSPNDHCSENRRPGIFLAITPTLLLKYSPDTGKSSSRETSQTSNLSPYPKKERIHASQTQTSLTSNLRPSSSGVFKRKCPITELFGQNAEFCNAMSPQHSNDYELKVYTYMPCIPTSGSQYINCSTDFLGLGVPWLISWIFACYWTRYTSTLLLVWVFPFSPTSHTALCFHWSSLSWAIPERTRPSASRYSQLQIFLAD